MSSYRYVKSHCGDKTVLRPSYLHNGISYTGKMTSLYWIGAQNGLYIIKCEQFITKWVLWSLWGRADSRFAPSQWETALLCNDVSHWLGASLESALLRDSVMLYCKYFECNRKYDIWFIIADRKCVLMVCTAIHSITIEYSAYKYPCYNKQTHQSMPTGAHIYTFQGDKLTHCVLN